MAIIALLFETYIVMIACALAGSFAIATAADCAWVKVLFVAFSFIYDCHLKIRVISL